MELIRGNLAGQHYQLAATPTPVVLAQIRQIVEQNIVPKSKNVSLLVVRQLEAMASPLQVRIRPDLSR